MATSTATASTRPGSAPAEHADHAQSDARHTTWRTLSAREIEALEASGCSATDWQRVKAAESFRPEQCAHVAFSGDIRLGECNELVQLSGGIELPAGIRHAALHDCTVGRNVFIRNVGRQLAHCEIGDHVIIDNVDEISAEGDSSFGNGVRVNVLSEAGGRAMPIHDRLSAHVAYLLALYRHRPKLTKRLEEMIAEYAKSTRGRRCSIGAGAAIVNCGSLTNVRIGPAARITGAIKLFDGTIHSDAAAPTKIGHGVIAEHFIVASGAVLDSGAIVTNSFVGQGAKIARQFCADHSLFFACSEALHGEAVSVFAGPFTVSHHKSSLLIAGLFSFFNAGSGTNQSNHLYKLGPLHQGVLERGCKTGSDAYLLWSSRVGAFTIVTGRHTGKFDTSPLPFSYLIEENGQDVLIPAANLNTVGTRRDVVKWRERDRRTDPDKLDFVQYEALNPHTIGNMLRGQRLLAAELSDEAQRHHNGRTHVSLCGVSIPRARLHKALSAYEMAVQRYLGGKLAERIESALAEPRGSRSIASLLDAPDGLHSAPEPWVDLCGLIAPAAAVEALLDDVETGKICGLAKLELRLGELHAAYGASERRWALNVWLAQIGKTAGQVTAADLIAAIAAWKDATIQGNNQVLRDAETEYKSSARLGFGIDGDAATAEADFAAVRGDFNQNPLVRAVREESAAVSRRAETLLAQLRELETMESAAPVVGVGPKDSSGCPPQGQGKKSPPPADGANKPRS